MEKDDYLSQIELTPGLWYEDSNTAMSSPEQVSFFRSVNRTRVRFRLTPSDSGSDGLPYEAPQLSKDGDDFPEIIDDERLKQAAEELITGDSDDPPLDEGMVANMLHRK